MRVRCWKGKENKRNWEHTSARAVHGDSMLACRASCKSPFSLLAQQTDLYLLVVDVLAIILLVYQYWYKPERNAVEGLHAPSVNS